jgi:hypothetical protein
MEALRGLPSTVRSKGDFNCSVCTVRTVFCTVSTVGYVVTENEAGYLLYVGDKGGEERRARNRVIQRPWPHQEISVDHL